MDLAVDIGGTKTLVAIFEEESIIPLRTEQLYTQPEKGFHDFLERLRAACDKLLCGESLRIWGVCTAGAVSEEGTLLWSPNLSWKNLQLKEKLSSTFGCFGIVENDCNAAAYAEARYRNISNLAYVTISTGIGMGLILDGKLFRGAHSAAGEIGHTVVKRDGPLCSCGRRGCLQAISSGKGLENQIFTLTNQTLNSKTILEYAESGLEPYRKVVEEATFVLARFLTNVVDTLDIETLVLGGGLMKNEFYFQNLSKYVLENYYKVPGKIISVESSRVEPTPGIVGAILLARLCLESELKS